MTALTDTRLLQDAAIMIARHIDGFHAATDDHAHAALLVGPAGMRARVFQRGARLVIHATPPADLDIPPRLSLGLVWPSITVNANRPAVEIARHIRLRLLPPLRVVLTEARARVALDHQQDQAAQRIAAGIAAALRATPHRVHGQHYERDTFHIATPPDQPGPADAVVTITPGRRRGVRFVVDVDPELATEVALAVGQLRALHPTRSEQQARQCP